MSEPLTRYRAGLQSAEITVMELLTASESVAATLEACQGQPELLALIASHRAGCERICAMLGSGMDPGADHCGVGDIRRLFDWSVAQDPSAAVALYSLGSEAVLARATAEILEWLDGRELVRGTVLDLGCGTGRLLPGLAARAEEVHALDVSAAMVERARAVAPPGVTVRQGSGQDLAGVPPCDLVLAVDSFPYVVQAGLEDVMLGEIERVLRPGGHLVVLNCSYRADLEADRRTLARPGLRLVDVTTPFALWNGVAFVLERS